MFFTPPRYLYPVQTFIASQALFELLPVEICRVIASYTDDHTHAKLRYELYITTRYKNSEITDMLLTAYVTRYIRTSDKLHAWSAQQVHDRIRASNAIEFLNYLYVNLRSKRIDRVKFAGFKRATVGRVLELSKNRIILTYYPREIMLLKELIEEE